MRNDGQKQRGGLPLSGRANGLIPTSVRALSSYLRIVSSGASTVASTVKSAASAASAIVDRDNDASHDQVIWGGFDKLEWDADVNRRVLLLGYRSGFQVWDVEDTDNIFDLDSRHDGPVSFMQVLPKPVPSRRSGDNFVEVRPLLAVCADGSLSGDGNVGDVFTSPCSGSTQGFHDSKNIGFTPTVVRFYSLRSQSYVKVLKFRSAVYSVRCSNRVIAILQATQIHCFGCATLEREYCILTNPIVTGCPGFGGIGYGPMAVGPRWLAYSGGPVTVSNSGTVGAQCFAPSACFPNSVSNGSVVAHYAIESSKQVAAGIVTLGDMGYKKLSRYYTELLPGSNTSAQMGNPVLKANGNVNNYLPDAENVGMVIIRDIVNKSVIAQFRAHKSPISSLCFDPSGTLLVTASVQGHNINVFRIIPGLGRSSLGSGSASGSSYIHLYTLQRGITNAVIQDISFSDDSNWIMVSSSRGTSHLFAISPSGGSINLQQPPDAYVTGTKSGSGVMATRAVRWPPNSCPQMINQQNLSAFGPPVTLSAFSRIRSGSNGWRSTVSGAAAVATGRASSLSGAIASAFHNCKGNDLQSGASFLKYYLLVFSPSGSVAQYALQAYSGKKSSTLVSGLGSDDFAAAESDARLVVEAIRKWNVCLKQNRRDHVDNVDIYGENGNLDSRRIYPEGIKKENSCYPEVRSSFIKAKICPEERHHLFVSEAELQTHQGRIPLCAKPEMKFQSIIIDGITIDGEEAAGGEIEIERLPAHMLEARSKVIVPAFDNHQTPKYQQTRSSIEGTGRGGLRMPTGSTKGFANNSGRLEGVNSRESLMMETKFKFVNKSIGGLKMENDSEEL